MTTLTYYTLQIITITALGLMSLSAVLRQPRGRDNFLFAMICISLATYSLVAMQFISDPVFRLDLQAFWLPMQVLMNSGAGCLMLLCFSFFQDKKSFPIWMLILFAVQLCLSTLRPLFVPNELAKIDVEAIGQPIYFIFGNLPIAMQTLFAAVAVFWVVRGWQFDMVESRRTLRWVVMASIGIMTLIGTGTELYTMEASPENRVGINFFKAFAGAFIVCLIALVSMRFQFFSDIQPRKTQTNVVTDDPTERDLQAFKEKFEAEKAYLQPGLSVANLAEQLSIPQYRLRSLINKALGYRNFNALLNEYRVRDAAIWLENPEERQTPVLTIALSVGYQSIAPFNSAFKEQMGMTPSAYRKAKTSS